MSYANIAQIVFDYTWQVIAQGGENVGAQGCLEKSHLLDMGAQYFLAYNREAFHKLSPT